MTPLREVPNLLEIREVLEFALFNEDNSGALEALGQLRKWIEGHAAALTSENAAAGIPAVTEDNLPAGSCDRPDGDPKIGDAVEDGTIFAGFSPDTGKAMYATPKDAPGTYTFNEAARYAENLDAHGHHDFHAPSEGELNVLYENRNRGKLTGTFNETGSYPADWYWSSTPNSSDYAWRQRFSDGNQNNSSRINDSSLRLIR